MEIPQYNNKEYLEIFLSSSQPKEQNGINLGQVILIAGVVIIALYVINHNLNSNATYVKINSGVGQEQRG